jgi:sporulation protein YlmC with PRC-barrel domain
MVARYSTTHSLSTNSLNGKPVLNYQGERLGHISDLMIEMPYGRIAYAVMSVGGFLGIGDKQFVVPWSALKVERDQSCLRLDADKQKLTKAPGFDKQHLPSLEDRAWQSQVHAHYGTKPYWEETDHYTG